jgi:hypothetical protein
MLKSSDSSAKYILIITVLFTLLNGVLLFIHPPALYPDPSWGFQVLRGMRMGGGFNMLPGPYINDITKNAPSFLAWWSPGQYLLPYLFISLFNVTIGHSVALTVTLCSIVGLLGWNALFKKLGFTPLIAALSIAFIVCQQAYWVPFVFYNGGEILLFAFTAWFLYGCSYFNKSNWLMVVFIFIAGVTGFFCKSSFLWLFFSGLLYLWIRLSTGNKLNKWLINGLVIGIPALLSLVAIYATYLSKGENPTSVALGIKISLSAFTFPLASPLLAGLSADDITNGLIYHNGAPLFSPAVANLVLIILAIASIILITAIIKLSVLTDYKLLLLLFYIVATLFFGISFLRQANISYEARHMRVIGLIITPGIVYLCSRLNVSFRVAFSIIGLYIAYTSSVFYYNGYHRNRNQAAHGPTGIAQLFIDQPTLNYVIDLDKQHQNATFIFTSPDLGLEIQHNRIITFNPVNDELYAENMNTYYGHAGPVFIVLPKIFLGAKAHVYMDHLTGYHNYTVTPIGNYIIYSAK